MQKKFYTGIIVLLLLSFFIYDYFFLKLDGYINFNISFVFVIIGLLIYPTKYKFATKTDMLVLLIITLILFDIINLIFINSYKFRLVFVNYLIIAFSIFQYLFLKHLDVKKSGVHINDKNNIRKD